MEGGRAAVRERGREVPGHSRRSDAWPVDPSPPFPLRLTPPLLSGGVRSRGGEKRRRRGGKTHGRSCRYPSTPSRVDVGTRTGKSARGSLAFPFHPPSTLSYISPLPTYPSSPHHPPSPPLFTPQPFLSSPSPLPCAPPLAPTLPRSLQLSPSSLPLSPPHPPAAPHLPCA